MYSPTCVADYMLTGNESAKNWAVMAADHLINRFNEKGNFINAWAWNGADAEKRAVYNFYIVDCLMNIPLLYWAERVTGNKRYKEIAEKHLYTTMTLLYVLMALPIISLHSTPIPGIQ